MLKKDTNIDHIDTDLILNDYLDIDTFPTINFKSTSFQKKVKHQFLKRESDCPKHYKSS
jgi:polyisoprenoid-binding protein YceI